MDLSEWTHIQQHILELEARGLTTRTFRRLDPARQLQVLDAILEEAIEYGPSAASVKRISERAGVAVGSLYNYFQDRESMLAFTVELCARTMIEALRAYEPYLHSLPLRDALQSYMLGGMEWSQTQTGLVRFFLRAAYSGDRQLHESLVQPVAEAMLGFIESLLNQAQERGELRQDLDLPAMSRVIHAWIVAVGDSQLLPSLNAYLQVTGSEIPFERALEAMLEAMLSGMGGREASQP